MTSKKNPSTATAETEGVARDEPHKIKCGLIMPISKSQGLEPEHWLNVKGIICEALADTEFDIRLVSESDDVGVIHKSIVQNIYKNDIVICDVSTHNANVMFELGLRLAFDKPTVIIKDDETPFSFDTQVIEHLVYKRSLHYVDIVSFKKKLKDKVLATLEQSRQPDFSTFLGHFTINHVSKIEERTVSVTDALVERFDQMQKTVNVILRQQELQNNNVMGSDLVSYNKRKLTGHELSIRNNLRHFLSRLNESGNFDKEAIQNLPYTKVVAMIDALATRFSSYMQDINPNIAPYPPSLIIDEIEKYIEEKYLK
ncbi:hypothetical protein [Aeromonas caviae]|uniref:hypothetical protein n=1 Tax=Aeromonas caviae TaxID=648 RepID=UPI0029DB78D5|nr:hypothetical protein [Aeromonas caviae]MDX7850146.1 hypothetical protein [Aeromonas caviae]